MREYCSLSDEMKRAKALLGEKCLDSHRTREDSHVKGCENEELRQRLAFMQKEIEAVKAERAIQCRDIAALNDTYNKLCVDRHN